MAGVTGGGPEPEGEGGDPACWAHEFHELLYGEPAEEDVEGDVGEDPATR